MIIYRSMKKNIIIWGTSRSGKSTLALYLSKKFSYSIIDLDSIIGSFYKVYPQLGINHNDVKDKVVKNLSPFLWTYLLTLNAKENRLKKLNYIFEGSYFDINDILDTVKNNRIKVVIVLTLYDNYEKYFQEIRDHDNEYDWTYNLPDSVLLNHCKNLYIENWQIKTFCEMNKIKYYDMSFDRKKIFKKIYKDLKKNMEYVYEKK